MQKIAEQFGQALDKDDFDSAMKLLSLDCQYFIGEKKLSGPKEICQSYEQNMIEGRNKLDGLEWGQSKIEIIDKIKREFYVHFTDCLMHKGIKFTHRCKQKLRINADNLIDEIKHIDDPVEQDRLGQFYKTVGLK